MKQLANLKRLFLDLKNFKKNKKMLEKLQAKHTSIQATLDAEIQEKNREIKKKNEISEKNNILIKQNNDLASEIKFASNKISRTKRILGFNAASALSEALEELNSDGRNTRFDDEVSAVRKSGKNQIESLRKLSHSGPRSAAPLIMRNITNKEKKGYLLLNDTRTQNNIGCRSTTNSLIRAFEDNGLRFSSSVTLSEISWIAAALDRVCKQVRWISTNLDEFVKIFSEDEVFAPYRSLIDNSFGIIVNGEGSFYDKQKKGLALLVICHYCTSVAGKKVVIINHSISLTDETMKSWTIQTANRVSFFAVRDPISYRSQSAELGTLQQYFLGSDCAFLAKSQRKDKKSDKDSDLPTLSYGSDSFLSTKIQQKYCVISGTSSIFRPDRQIFENENKFHELCTKLSNLGIQPVLWEADAADDKLLRPIAAEHGYPYVSACVTEDTVLDLLANATCIISGRWHASILAASVGTPPILGDANFFKTKALAEMLQLGWNMFDFRLFDTDLLIETVRTIDSDRMTIGSKIAVLAEQQANLAAEMVAKACKVFDDHEN